MKKAFALVGLSAVLASCGGLSSGGDLIIDESSLTLTSQFTVQNVPFRGGTYSGPVICDDRATNLQLAFNYAGSVNTVDARLQGATTGSVSGALNVTNTTNTGSRVTVDFFTSPGSVPLSVPNDKLTAQAIIVSPIVNPVIIGGTRVQIVAHSPLGQTDTLNTNYLPVVDNCPAV
ncbi:hypothetical protein [Deinococcus yavapaiensis]|uniref:Lipoprotein n=1 Tax=Deinococcus yavapaiensis KR-236 TaxID=694435 RepID=A0A318S7F6_9DEIO|nr:hypothetical protein [Deinococcus yavapaiensis]PYE54846.1 hypothetical protein DES52_104117 [Deinococcus yavapaiensis KR-236]